MIRVRVSYVELSELEELLQLLQPYVVKQRRPVTQNGPFKRAYLELEIKSKLRVKPEGTGGRINNDEK